MFRILRPCYRPWRRFPRMRGDVPVKQHAKDLGNEFSPHARGCSGHRTPATPLTVRFPRMRGDVPHQAWRRKGLYRFSPHARGCSELHTTTKMQVKVFPAYAGMFLYSTHGGMQMTGFPRMRGDVPW